MMLQLLVYLPMKRAWLRFVRFVTHRLNSEEIYSIEDSIASQRESISYLGTARNLISNDERRKRERRKEKEAVLIFFLSSSRKYSSIHFSLKWARKRQCDVSNFHYIFIHNGLDNVVAFEEISISHRICFFFFSFYLHFYRTSATFMGTMWKFLNISTWVWNISKFSVFFSRCLSLTIQFSTTKRASHGANRCYANNLKQHSIRLIGERIINNSVTTVFFMCFDFYHTHTHITRKKHKM